MSRFLLALMLLPAAREAYAQAPLPAPEQVPPPSVIGPIAPPVPPRPAPYITYYSGPGVSFYSGPPAVIYQANPVPIPATIYTNYPGFNFGAFFAYGGYGPRHFGGYQGQTMRRFR